jgi:hypothetical protein
MPTATPARVLFDEAHSEAWTIRAEVAAAMQPAHPQDASYARAASALTERDFAIHPNVDQKLRPETLAGVDLLVIAHPSDPAWERTTGSGSPRLSDGEIDAIVSYVDDGGGLIVLGETEQEKYGNNLNELLARFGLHIDNETVQDYEHSVNVPSWILAELDDGGRGTRGDVLAQVRSICLYRAGTLSASNGARILARTHGSASTPGAPLIASTEHGAGKVVVLADSDLFGDDCLDELDHRALWLNLCYWASRADGNGAVAWGERAVPRGERPVESAGASTRSDPAWLALREETNALARLQAPDGAVAGARFEALRHVVAIAEAIEALRDRFGHQADYLDAVLADLRSWQEDGFEVPDFTASLALFRPELMRVDGIEHLVFFPMYKQNGSRDVCCEALLVRVPWPDWIAELERTRYDNPKFVPVELIDGTDGYDSECAVLFPEMVSIGDPPARPPNNFGAIFCDREAERLRRIGGAAADLLALNLPPDAARMLASPEVSELAYILWDLIHDRTHSHGELPFDPFMIRQRAPYWMYSLEELRCDLTAFCEAVELERRAGGKPASGPIAFARYVRYAILLDRLLRFPIAGTRVRNYDGLGGQLLFAFLHRHGYLHWADNRLTIDWDRVGDGVAALREEIEGLYRAGIDRTKLQHWVAAHEKISESVPPAAGSKWAAGARELPELQDPRPYVDLVLDDEFPLSIFYSSLKAKLGS